MCRDWGVPQEEEFEGAEERHAPDPHGAEFVAPVAVPPEGEYVGNAKRVPPDPGGAQCAAAAGEFAEEPEEVDDRVAPDPFGGPFVLPEEGTVGVVTRVAPVTPLSSSPSRGRSAAGAGPGVQGSVTRVPLIVTHEVWSPGTRYWAHDSHVSPRGKFYVHTLSSL